MHHHVQEVGLGVTSEIARGIAMMIIQGDDIMRRTPVWADIGMTGKGCTMLIGMNFVNKSVRGL
jgi:hypothetical protein